MNKGTRQQDLAALALDISSYALLFGNIKAYLTLRHHKKGESRTYIVLLPAGKPKTLPLYTDSLPEIMPQFRRKTQATLHAWRDYMAGAHVASRGHLITTKTLETAPQKAKPTTKST